VPALPTQYARSRRGARARRAAVGSLLVVPALLVGAACSSDSTVSSSASTAPAAVKVTLTASGCDPASFNVAPGAVVFSVQNSSGSSGEFEILTSKPTIVGEVEKIPDDGADTLAVTLDTGTYDIVCGTGSKLTGALVVGDGKNQATGTTVDTAELDAAVADYTAYVSAQVADIVTQTKDLETAVAAGDLAGAKAVYGRSRLGYERVEPVAELFPEFDAKMDSRADDHPRAEADPDFTGWHRIEYELYSKGDTKAALPFATALAADAVNLQQELARITIDPSTMVNGAAGLIEEASATKITGEEDRYSQRSLLDLAANVEGSKKIVALLAPLLTKADPALLTLIQQDFSVFDTTLAPFATSNGGYTPYDQVSDADKAKFKAVLAQTSEDLAQIAGVLGLEVN